MHYPMCLWREVNVHLLVVYALYCLTVPPQTLLSNSSRSRCSYFILYLYYVDDNINYLVYFYMRMDH